MKIIFFIILKIILISTYQHIKIIFKKILILNKKILKTIIIFLTTKTNNF
jgi:hypothetical protein